jgi:hypothetical protein
VGATLLRTDGEHDVDHSRDSQPSRERTSKCTGKIVPVQEGELSNGSKLPRIVISVLDGREYPASRFCRRIQTKGSPSPKVEFG